MENGIQEISKPGRKTQPPLQYRNEVLEQAFRNRRDINVTQLCSDLKMSRQTFYSILRGGVRVTREKVEKVALALDADTAKLFA